MIDLENVTLHYVESVEEVNEFMRWLSEDHSWLGFDLETEGLRHWTDKIRLFQFGDENTAFAFRADRWLGVMEEVLSKYEGSIVGHNVFFDVRFSEFNGIQVPKKNLHDTMNMSHIIDPVKSVALKTRTSAMLSPQAKRLSGALAGAMKAQGWDWSTVPVDFPIYHFYGAFDCILTARLAETYFPRIESEFRAVYDLEMEVSRICSNMEYNGVRVDLPYCDQKYDEFTEYCQATEAWCLEHFGVMPSENQQVAIALVKDGVDLSKTTPSGQQFSTDKDVLDGIDHPLAKAVLGHRKASKLRQSYFRNFREMNDHGILHPSIRTLGARTARMSVREPALQTLPQGPIVRNGFIPRDGMVWVSADFDNVEMRLLAHFSGDPGLLEAARTSDMHLEMAKLAYGDQDILKKDPRRQTMKNANFAKAYVAGNEQFARTAGIDLDQAIAFLDLYDERFPGVKLFQKNVQNVAMARFKEEGQAYIKTPLGRRHPSAKDKIYTLVNYLIQGSAADSFKQSLIDLDMAGFGPYMLMPVHDEQNFEIPADQLEDMIPQIRETMLQSEGWKVPLTVSIGTGASWGDAK